MKKSLFTWVDPHHQSFLFFPWKSVTILVILAGSFLITINWQSSFVKFFLDNILVYLPNYLTHEILGHNLVGNLFYQTFYDSHRALGEWIATLAGNGIETLIPLIACWFVLRLEGGRWTLPPLLYWLSTTFYGAGVYAQDARACSMALTSSDMVTNYAPGEKCGDWHHILEPLGLLNYDQWFAYAFMFIGSLLFMLAIYSAWYYWTHPNFYTSPPTNTQDVTDWQPPTIYNPQSHQATGDRKYPANVHADQEKPVGLPRLSDHSAHANHLSDLDDRHFADGANRDSRPTPEDRDF